MIQCRAVRPAYLLRLSSCGRSSCFNSPQNFKTLVSSLAYTRSGVCNVRLSVSPGLQLISTGFRGGRRPFHQTQSEACCDERIVTNTMHSRTFVFTSHHSELPKPSLICEPIRERLAGTGKRGVRVIRSNEHVSGACFRSGTGKIRFRGRGVLFAEAARSHPGPGWSRSLRLGIWQLRECFLFTGTPTPRPKDTGTGTCSFLHF